MKDDRSELGQAIEQALREAVAFERGELQNVRTTRRQITARHSTVAPPPAYPPARIRRVRDRIGLSQPVFAKALNVSDSTVRAWEQGKRSPDGPSLRLLEFAEREPESFLRSLTVSSSD